MIVFPGKNRLYGDLRQPIVTGLLDIGQGAAAGSIAPRFRKLILWPYGRPMKY
jgi:hypothetical protein